MVIPDTFGIRGERTIASYDYYDIAEGTGNIVFNLAVTSTSAGQDYILTSETPLSEEAEIFITTGAIGNTNTAIRDTKDYDLTEFNLPKNIKGTAFISHSLSFRGTAASGGSCYLKYILKKNTTTIVTVQSKTIGTAVATAVNFNFLTPLTIPLTNFKKGDILKLTIEVWGATHTANYELLIYYGSSPNNKDGVGLIPSTDTDPTTKTKSELTIPFKINL